MAQRVAQVQDPPQVAFALVLRDDVAPSGGRRRRWRSSSASASQPSSDGGALAQGLEERAVADDPALQDLVGAGLPLARGERVQERGIDDTARGWWKAPIMFLARGWLMPTFPPIELSTMARSVVGTQAQSTPRM